MYSLTLIWRNRLIHMFWSYFVRHCGRVCPCKLRFHGVNQGLNHMIIFSWNGRACEIKSKYFWLISKHQQILLYMSIYVYVYLLLEMVNHFDTSSGYPWLVRYFKIFHHFYFQVKCRMLFTYPQQLWRLRLLRWESVAVPIQSFRSRNWNVNITVLPIYQNQEDGSFHNLSIYLKDRSKFGFKTEGLKRKKSVNMMEIRIRTIARMYLIWECIWANEMASC